jgi:hypothetical protein
LKYEVRPVGGPGSPGVLYVEGERFNVKHIYAPPSMQDTEVMAMAGAFASPSVPFGPDQPGVPPPGYTFMGFGTNGMPAYMNTAEYKAIGNDRIAMSIYPHAKLPQAGPGAPQPPRALDAGASFRQQLAQSLFQQQMTDDWAVAEAQKMAAGAQARLADEVSRVEAANDAIRRTNQHALLALKETIGRSPGEDRNAWASWWRKERGYGSEPGPPRQKPTFTVGVPLPYVPTTGPPVLTPTGGAPRFCPVENIVKNVPGKTHAVALTVQCFAAGTLVQTDSAQRPIEAIREGDLVLTRDLTTGSDLVRPVLSVHHSASATTVRLRYGRETVTATGSHPFYLADVGWTRADDLRAGDRVESRDGTVTVAEVVPDADRPVYNLRVGGGRTFFVGRDGLLVHDGSPVDQPAAKGAP